MLLNFLIRVTKTDGLARNRVKRGGLEECVSRARPFILIRCGLPRGQANLWANVRRVICRLVEKRRKRVTTCLPLMHSLFAVHKEGAPSSFSAAIKQNGQGNIRWIVRVPWFFPFLFFFFFFVSRVRSCERRFEIARFGRWSKWG